MWCCLRIQILLHHLNDLSGSQIFLAIFSRYSASSFAPPKSLSSRCIEFDPLVVDLVEERIRTGLNIPSMGFFEYDGIKMAWKQP